MSQPAPRFEIGQRVQILLGDGMASGDEVLCSDTVVVDRQWFQNVRAQDDEYGRHVFFVDGWHYQTADTAPYWHNERTLRPRPDDDQSIPFDMMMAGLRHIAPKDLPEAEEVSA